MTECQSERLTGVEW